MTNPSLGLDNLRALRQAPATRTRICIAAVLVLGLLASAVLFDRLPEFLISEEQWSKADYVLILGGNACVHEAAQWYRDGRVEHIVLVERWRTPAVRLNIQPPFEDHARRVLVQGGVPLEAIEQIPASARNCWDHARALEPWLTSHPHARLDVLSERLSSGRERYILSCSLGSDRAAQLRVFGLPDSEVVERGWWHHRLTLKAVAGSCLAFAFDYLHGPPPAGFRPNDPVAFARAIIESQNVHQRPKDAADRPDGDRAGNGNHAQSGMHSS